MSHPLYDGGPKHLSAGKGLSATGASQSADKPGRFFTSPQAGKPVGTDPDDNYANAAISHLSQLDKDPNVSHEEIQQAFEQIIDELGDHDPSAEGTDKAAKSEAAEAKITDAFQAMDGPHKELGPDEDPPEGKDIPRWKDANTSGSTSKGRGRGRASSGKPNNWAKWDAEHPKR